MNLNESEYLKYSVISIPFIVLSFFMWRGIKGLVGRYAQYGALISLMVAIYLIKRADTNKKIKFATYLCLAIVIVSSILAYTYHNQMNIDFVTYYEKEAIGWYVYYNKGERVFTDFRVGTSYFLFNYWNVETIMTIAFTYSENKLNEIKAIFRDVNYVSFNLICNRYNSKIIFLSNEIIKRGVILPSERVSVMDDNTIVKYRTHNKTSEIYNNNFSYYFYISN